MTMEHEFRSENKFVLASFPWLLAGAAFIVYLATFNHWVTVRSTPLVAAVSGWNFAPSLTSPVYWVVTFPIRWLPPSLIPIALNLFSVVCASLVVWLLARSVALLPHDRTQEERSREKGAYGLLTIRQAWLPPLLAVVLCGFQLSFWESATAASNDMLDLLLLAYCIRCLLEFRLWEQDTWLVRASFVYGAAMANNWAMIALFPFFLAALVRLKGLSFFNFDFLVRMFFLGLAGVAFYLVLPLTAMAAHPGEVTFWTALKANLMEQKYFVLLVYNRHVLFGDSSFWVLALPSLVPILAMSIRWPSYFGDPSQTGLALTKLMFHCLNGLLLLFCAWVCLDPQRFSMRNLGVQGLPFYYLAALSVGYYAGYFLLVFAARPPGRRRPEAAYLTLLRPVILGAVWLVAAGFAVTIVSRNLPQIRLTNGSLLEEYAAAILGSLPPKGVVLADAGQEASLFLTQSALVKSGKAGNYVLVHTGWLKAPEYHRYLKRHYPAVWQSTPPKTRKQPFEDVELMQTIASLAQSNALYYLHPSFGYYFELFYPVPHGLVYELKNYPQNALYSPPLSDALIEENQAFWSKLKMSATIAKELKAAEKQPKEPGFGDRIVTKLHLARVPNPHAYMLGYLCSRSANCWGVSLQRSGHLAQARLSFERAIELNPDNTVAQVNLEANQTLLAGKEVPLRDSKSVEDSFGRYRNWSGILNANGPFDDPAFCYPQGLIFAQGSCFRQAAQECGRSCELAPSFLLPRFWLAKFAVILRLPDDALKEVAELRRRMDALGAGRTNQADLLSIEMSAYLVKGEEAKARASVDRLLSAYPADEAILAAAGETYMNSGLLSNALQIIDLQLKLHPDDASSLINQGCALLRLNSFDQAIQALSRAVTLEENNRSEAYYTALFNRAICYLRIGKFGESKHDYEILQQTSPNAYKIAYGLGEIAYQTKDTNAAVRNYRTYLTYGPTNSAEAKEVRARLKELKPGQR